VLRRWNPKDQWVVSERQVHAALVSEADFVAAQSISALAQADDGGVRRYQLTGLVFVRRMSQAGRGALGTWPTRLPLPARADQR
jgi:site-specific DNA recombinase